jgi:hypothetical protein
LFVEASPGVEDDVADWKIDPLGQRAGRDNDFDSSLSDVFLDCLPNGLWKSPVMDCDTFGKQLRYGMIFA